MLDITKYKQLKEAGISPRHIYLALHKDAIEYIACIKILRQLLNIPVRDAKDIITSTNKEEQVQNQPANSNHQAITPEQRDSVLRVIQFFNGVRERPGMFIGSQILALPYFLYGVDVGVTLCGIGNERLNEERRHILKQVTLERGWDWSEEHIVNRMHSLGYPYPAIVNETVTIEIEVWQRLFNTPSR